MAIRRTFALKVGDRVRTHADGEGVAGTVVGTHVVWPSHGQPWTCCIVEWDRDDATRSAHHPDAYLERLTGVDALGRPGSTVYVPGEVVGG